MPRTVVIGIDPSSRKLAAVFGVVGDEPNIQYMVKKLPQDKPTACLAAYEWAHGLVTSQVNRGLVYVAVELPVFGRGGPGSTIPQAQINGALLAGIKAAGGTAILVNNSRAKKEVVGKGNANKDDIRRWVKVAWPALYEHISADQDLCDSAMIYFYGKKTVDLRDKIARKKRLNNRTTIARRKIKRKAP